MSERLADFMESRSQRFQIAVALLLAILVWSVDYATGPFLSASIFYLAPVAVAAWWAGRRSGIFLSLLCALAWLGTDLATNPAELHPLIPYWNAAVRLGFFLIVTVALNSLRRARQRQEDLTSFVVHDLRSPLANVMTALDLIEDVLPRGGDQTVHTLLAASKVSSRRMLVLINSLLDLARLESGRMPINADATSVADIVDQAKAQVAVMARRKQVTIETSGLPAGAMVAADRELLLRVLVNLLSNAIHFSPESGAIVVGGEGAGRHLQLSIQDQGPGIPAQWQKQVFRKFSQVQARKSGAATGSGLGLTFCRLAIEAQGGRIWLAPSPPPGTTVHFTLPLASANGDEAPA